jgi:acyl carrier protein
MRLASADRQRGFRESGLEPMPAAEALDALGRLLGGSDSQAVVARIDWSILKPLHETRRARPFLSRLGAVAAPARQEVPSGSSPVLAARLAAAPAGMRQELIVEFVRHEVAAVLGLDQSRPVPLDTGLFELGMDSLMSVELKRRLERGTGRSLPSTLTFNYPSVSALAGFLERELSTGLPEAPAALSAAGTEPAALPSVGEDLGMLTDAELEARLLARLEQTR